MNLMTKIMEDIRSLRRQQVNDSLAVLTTLFGEASSIGKTAGNRETTDSEVVALVKKFIANNNETLKHLNPSDPRVLKIENENKILSAYVPKQLSRIELTDIINNSAPKPLSVKDTMSYFKNNYTHQYDGKELSTILKEILA